MLCGLLSRVPGAGRGPEASIITETWSPTDNVGFTLSSGNATASQTNQNGAVRTSGSHTTGKWYLELVINTMTGNIFDGDVVGLTLAGSPGSWTAATSFYLRNDGLMFLGGVSVGVSVNSLHGAANNVLGFAIDRGNQTLWVRNQFGGNTWTGPNFSLADPATNTNGIDISTVFGAAAVYSFLNADNTTTDIITINQSLTFTAPSGFLQW